MREFIVRLSSIGRYFEACAQCPRNMARNRQHKRQTVDKSVN